MCNPLISSSMGIKGSHITCHARLVQQDYMYIGRTTGPHAEQSRVRVTMGANVGGPRGSGAGGA